MDRIVLLATTDIHGSVCAHSYADNSIQAYGLSRFSNAVKHYRKECEVLVLDNGDILQGTPFLTTANQTHVGKHILSVIMNAIGYDHVNLGNHDFNYGYGVLHRYLDDLKAPCLTSNIVYHDKPFGESKRIKTTSGKTIALIGVCTDYIPHWEKPSHIKSMRFCDPVETVQQELSKLKGQADLVVVMYHGGLERDPCDGSPTERFTGENVGYRLATLEGIDILITGHQHRSFTTIINGTHVVQTAANAVEFARITIDFQDIPAIDIQIEKTGEYPVDPMIEKLGESVETKTQAGLDVALGRIAGPSLKITDAFDARLRKHPLVSFINQVQREASGADLSACALFNGVVGFDAKITYRDIVSTYVYPNTLVVKRMDGKALKLFLEKCAEYFSVKDDKIIINPAFDDPKPLHFNYDMVDGIAYTIKVSNPIGQRIINMEYQGQPIVENDVFTLVMNNYRAVGGGDFMMAASAETLSEVNRDMVEILAEALSGHKVYTLHHTDNITIIK